MAASGPMADFARMPTQRKVLVFVIAGAFIGLLYYRFAYSGLKESVAQAQGGFDAAQIKNTQLAADLKAYEDLKPRMEALRTTIVEQQKALPTEAEVPAFFETLVRKAKEVGVDVKVSPKKEEPIEKFVKIPADIELQGTFMQIKRFFASLLDREDGGAGTGDAPANGQEERDRIVSIENLVVANPTVRNGQIVLNAKFTAVTFRQDQKPATPGAPGAPNPAGTPATPLPTAPPPTGATPPMPSTGTIGRVKSQVNDALQKTEATRGSAELKGNP